jgi:hypothetical protein
VTNEERAKEIVTGLLDICGVAAKTRPQLERFVNDHLDEVERSAAEKAIIVYREKVAEAAMTVSTQTAIGAPTTDPVREH